MDLNELTIGQVKEVAALVQGSACKEDAPRLADEGQRVLAVLQRGWVVAGEYHQDGMRAELRDAAVVRRWGTSNGLGELAEKGPQPNTKLDPCPPVSFHVREAVMVMECSDAWGK